MKARVVVQHIRNGAIADSASHTNGVGRHESGVTCCVQYIALGSFQGTERAGGNGDMPAESVLLATVSTVKDSAHCNYSNR